MLTVEHFVITGPASAPQGHNELCAATLLLEDSTGAIQSLGSAQSKHEIRAGDLHWTRDSESVLRTQQRPDEARLHGLRFVLDLPDAIAAPPVATALVRGWEMPVIQTDAGRIRVVAGSHGGWQSPLVTPEPLMILDGWLRPGATRLVPLTPGWNAWLYALKGDLGLRARHCQNQAPARPKRPGGDPDFAVVAEGAALVAGATSDDEAGVLVLMAGKAPAHFVLVAGRAIAGRALAGRANAGCDFDGQANAGQAVAEHANPEHANAERPIAKHAKEGAAKRAPAKEAAVLRKAAAAAAAGTLPQDLAA